MAGLAGISTADDRPPGRDESQRRHAGLRTWRRIPVHRCRRRRRRQRCPQQCPEPERAPRQDPSNRHQHAIRIPDSAVQPIRRSTPGLDEIFAYGMRNPWRLSFDRQHRSRCGSATSGRTDGKRSILRSSAAATTAGASSRARTARAMVRPHAIPPTTSAPVIEYAHASGRCSITGGYVYRGSQGTFPSGTYLYADYCTGEIFTSNSGGQRVLQTTNISSFGEDQAGEIYVVRYGGGTPGNGNVGRLRLPPGPCTYSINPTSRTIAASGGTGTVAVTTGPDCTWTAGRTPPGCTSRPGPAAWGTATSATRWTSTPPSRGRGQ